MRIRQLSFSEWWEKDIIAKNGQAHLTRKQLVLALRNQEGGGHYDDELRNPNFVGSRLAIFHMSSDTPTTAQLGLELAAMRQVGWELAKSLDAYEAKQK